MNIHPFASGFLDEFHQRKHSDRHFDLRPAQTGRRTKGTENEHHDYDAYPHPYPHNQPRLSLSRPVHHPGYGILMNICACVQSLCVTHRREGKQKGPLTAPRPSRSPAEEKKLRTGQVNSFNRVIKNVQNFSTDSIWTFSSGEWGFLMVGPNEIISMPGYFSPIMPHSNPA